MSAAKSYTKARAVYQKVEEVKLGLEASQQKKLESVGGQQKQKGSEWKGEQFILEQTKWCKDDYRLPLEGYDFVRYVRFFSLYSFLASLYNSQLLAGVYIPFGRHEEAALQA